MPEQRITYLHGNPVRAGFVELAESQKLAVQQIITQKTKGIIGIVSVY
jgi:hypothetical protein